MKSAVLYAMILSALLVNPAAAQVPSATFDFVEYRALEPDESAPGIYRNPVLPGFHPDPSIVGVGEDFYLVTSTFSWFPGLPVFHSRNLVDWRLLNNAINRPGMVDLSNLGTARGLFAPAITHHGGRFWIVNTCVDCGGNFVITAERPEGPWSDPVWLSFGGIDPSLFFDDDGRAWIVYNDAPPGEPRYEGHRALWLQQFDPAAMQVLPERTLLVDGGVDLAAQPIWAEGPHLYHVGEYYYLLAAEGGTAEQHSQTVYRSRSVQGPFVPGPINPILTQRDLPAGRADRVEATGHADLVEIDGQWWGVFLGTRPFGGQSTLLGRETFLLPVRWEDGWLSFLRQGEPVPLQQTRPALPASPGTNWSEWLDDFSGKLSPEWIGLRTPGTQQFHALADGRLALVPGADPAGTLGRPSFLGRRMRHHAAQYVTRMTFDAAHPDDFAGLLAFMDEAHFLACGIEGDTLAARRRTAADQPGRGAPLASAPRPGTGALDLRLRIENGRAECAWRPAGAHQWRPIATDIDVEPLASVHAGLFTGLVVGPYAVRGE